MAPAADAGTITLGDLTVNRMGYGAMRITGPGIWGDPPDPEASKGVLRRTLELGVNFIDTASAYEASERLIGEALAPYSDGVVVASKAGLYRTGPGEWPIDSSPEAIRRQTEQSHRSPAILVIPGTNSLEHLEENVAAASLRLDDDDVSLLSG